MKKIALVTGAAGGIGTAISEKFISEMDGLILVDIDADKLDLVKKKIENKSSIVLATYCCDVGNFKQVSELLNVAKIEIGVPTVLVNNAGIGGPFHRVDEVSDDEWYQIINTNLKAIFNFAKILLPLMKHVSYGRIINIASVQGFLGAALSSTYVASKHGVIGYTRAIAVEWGAYGVTCNAICPGYVNTVQGVQDDKVKNHYESVIAKTPVGRVAQPSEIANIVSYLVRDETSFINGSVLTVDGGLTCHVGV